MYYINRTTTLPKSLKGPFFTYEGARSAVRSWLRKSKGVTGNPPINMYGFTISRS